MSFRSAIYLVMSPRPQVGRTLVARLLLDFFLFNARAAEAFDLNDEGDLPRFFPAHAERASIVGIKDQMALFDRLIAGDGVNRIVDVGPLALRPFLDVLRDTGFALEARERRIAPSQTCARGGIGGREDVGGDIAMRTERALWITGRAACVAHPHRHVLVGRAPREVLVAARDQVLVKERVGQPPCRLARGVEQHVVLNTRRLRRQLLVKRQQRAVDEDDLVLGVVDDIAQLVGKEADVERVADRTGARHGIVELQVLVVVPGKGAHAVARLDAELHQRLGQPLDAFVHLAIGHAVQAAVRLHRRHALVGIEVVGVLDELVQRQLPVHHEALHRRTLLSLLRFVLEIFA